MVWGSNCTNFYWSFLSINNIPSTFRHPSQQAQVYSISDISTTSWSPDHCHSYFWHMRSSTILHRLKYNSSQIEDKSTTPEYFYWKYARRISFWRMWEVLLLSFKVFGLFLYQVDILGFFYRNLLCFGLWTDPGLLFHRGCPSCNAFGREFSPKAEVPTFLPQLISKPGSCRKEPYCTRL